MGGAVPPLFDMPSQDNSTFFCYLSTLNDAPFDPIDLYMYLKHTDVCETAVLIVRLTVHSAVRSFNVEVLTKLLVHAEGLATYCQV